MSSGLDNLVIGDDVREKIRLTELKNAFDNGLVSEKNISESDKEALIRLYDEETEILRLDTEKRVNEIKKILGV